MTFAIKDLIRRYKVGEHTVLGWIRNGELSAINVSKRPGGKPQWRVTEVALAEFELLRTKTPPQPRSTRRKLPSTPMIQFYK